SSKYLYLDEAAKFYATGKSLLIYQHFPRIERTVFLSLRAKQLRTVAPGCTIWAFTTAHVVFFLVVHPASPVRLVNAAIETSRRWEDDGFIRSQYLGRA